MAYGIKTKLDMDSIKQAKDSFSKLLTDMQSMANKNVIKIKIDQTNKQLNDVHSKFGSINKETRSFADNMNFAIKRVSQFALGIGVVYGAIRQLKGGIQEIIDLNKSNVNIAMITGQSVQEVEKMNKGWLDMANNLKIVNSEIVDGAESWLRSGVDMSTANQNLETTAKLSKIANESNKDMADSLITIKNAWDLNSKSVEDYASKVVYADNNSATSANKINKAMTYSAESFKANGVELNNAIAMITNFSEKSAKSGESIGRGFVSMMANFHKMQEGVKSGDEEELDAVNKLEVLLSKKGLALRKNKDEWLDLGTVIKSIQKNIDKFSDVEKSDLAFRIGGKENMELTLSTLNNMDRIDELNQKLKDDSGAKALNEAYSKHLDSIDAKMATLKNTATEFWMNLISSNAIKNGVDGLTSLVGALNAVASSSNTSKIAFLGFGTAFILLIKNWTGAITVIKNTIAFFQLLPLALSTTNGVTTLLSATFLKLSATLKTLFMTPAGLIFTGLAAAIGLATYAVGKHIKHQSELKEQTEELTESYKKLNAELKGGNASPNSDGYTSIKKAQDEINERLQKQVELRNKLNATPSKVEVFRGTPIEKNLDRVALQKEIDDNNKAIAEQEKVLANAGVQFQKTGDAVNGYKIQVAELTRVEIENANNEIANQVNEKAMAMWNNREAVISLIQEYQALSSSENQSIESKARMSAITRELQGYIVGLQTQTDQYGYSVITNTDLLGQNIDMLNTEGLTFDNLSQAISVFGMNNAKVQQGATEITYQQAKARIQILQQEVIAMQNLLNAQHQMQSETDGIITMSGMDKFLKQKQMELGDLNAQVSGIEAIFSKSRNSGMPSVGGSGYTPTSSGSSGSSDKSSAKEIADMETKLDLYYNIQDGIDKVNDALELNQTLQEKAQGKDKTRLMEEEIKLNERKLYSINELIKAYRREEQQLKNRLTNNGFEVENGEIKNLNDRLLAMQNWANSLGGDSKEQAIAEVKALEDATKRYIELINNDLPNSNKEWYEVSNAIKQAQDELINSVKDMQEKMTEVVKSEVDKRKKAIEDELDAKKDAVEKEKNLLNKQYAEDDYKSELAKEEQKLKEIEEAMLVMSRNTTAQGKAKLDALMQEYKAQQEKIDEMIKNNQRDRINEQFEEEQRRLEEEAQKKKDELDKKYDDKTIAQIALQAIMNGFFEFEGEIINTQNALMKFMDETGESLLVNGKLLQEEFINKLKEASEIIKTLGNMNISINMNAGNIPKYETGTPYIQGTQLAMLHPGESVFTKSTSPFNVGSNFTDLLRNALNKHIAKIIPSISTPISNPRGKYSTFEFNQPFVVVQGNVTEDSVGLIETMVDRKITDFKKQLDEWSMA